MLLDKDSLKKMLKNKEIKGTTDLNDILKKITKEVIDVLYEEELEDHLGYKKHEKKNEKNTNSRNGTGKKTVQSKIGAIDLEPPRDRLGTFDPQVVKKRQRDISGIEDKVISMYAKGMTTRDISYHIEDIYGYNLSAETISIMTDKVLEKARQWQARPLESIYSILYLDGMVFKIRKEGMIQKISVYIILGVDLQGNKSCLGMYFSENESSVYWLTVLNELKNRGVEDVLIFSVDNLKGISEAIEAVFPKAEIQKCVVHQIRNSLKYVPRKKRKEAASDLKKIYTAASLEQGEAFLKSFSQKWDEKYHFISKSWRTNWAELSTFFKYPDELRKIIYTTNPIESFNRSIRKVTKTRSIFSNQEAVLKLLYLATSDIEKRWNRTYESWGTIYSQLLIFFEDRLEKYV